MSFSMALARSETQTISFWIWTHVTGSISKDVKRYTINLQHVNQYAM